MHLLTRLNTPFKLFMIPRKVNSRAKLTEAFEDLSIKNQIAYLVW